MRSRSWQRQFNVCRSQVIRISCLRARPLGQGTSISTHRVLAFWLLRPASRRTLPPLLPPLDGQVQQPIACVHGLHAPHRRPVSFEDFAILVAGSKPSASCPPAVPSRPTKKVSREPSAEYQGIPNP